MQLLLPSSNEDPDADEPANLVYYRILAYSYFGGMQNLEEIPRIASNLEAFKKFILKFLNEFYVKTLIYKSHSKITRENEMIVKQILEIIITIILDDGYTPQKYERELTYISDNFITPNFFYYYVVSLILSVKMEPQVVTYIRDFITNEIANMNDEPNSKRFQLSRSSSRRGLRRELARGSTLIETLTPQEQNRYMPRRLFTAEFAKRIANNPEQLRYTFLGLMKRFYKMRTSPPNNEEDDTGNTYLFEKAVHPLLSLS
jgi:hypothetical protein